VEADEDEQLAGPAEPDGTPSGRVPLDRLDVQAHRNHVLAETLHQHGLLRNTKRICLSEASGRWIGLRFER